MQTTPWHAIVAALVVCVTACQERRAPLPQLEIPSDLRLDEEPLYLRAHWEQFMRSMRASEGTRFDGETQVHHQHLWIMFELADWDDEVGTGKAYLDYEIKQAYLRRTPDAYKFRGARQRAVALGLLAHSAWKRNPPPIDPSIADLQRCARGRPPECLKNFRARALRRMMLMATHADRALFHRLLPQKKGQK